MSFLRMAVLHRFYCITNSKQDPFLADLIFKLIFVTLINHSKLHVIQSMCYMYCPVVHVLYNIYVALLGV